MTDKTLETQKERPTNMQRQGREKERERERERERIRQIEK